MAHLRTPRPAAAASPLHVVPPPAAEIPAAPSRLRPDLSAALYRKILLKLADRVREVHGEIRERPGRFGALPMHRELTEEEAGELAWRVYSLACATGQSVAWLAPELLILASEWWASPVPDDWEALVALRFQ